LPLFARLSAPDQGSEQIAPLPAMALSEHVLTDYQTIRLSLKGYPTQFLRDRFDAEGIVSCKGVGDLKDGAPVRCAGVVLVRQRPGEGTAIFVTLSDETGVCNVVIWERLFKLYRKEVMGARLLVAEGLVQKSPEGVVHLMATRLIDRSQDLNLLSDDALPPVAPTHRHPRNVRVLPPSRDFH
jgi:error-prone DNA polymerase